MGKGKEGPSLEWGKGEFEASKENWHCQLLADRRVTHRQSRIASRLLWYVNRKTGAAFPSFETLAQGTGVLREHVAADMKELSALGYLVREPRQRKRARGGFDETGEFFYYPAINGKRAIVPKDQWLE